MREAKLRVKTFQNFIIDEKLRFAISASLRFTILTQIQMTNKLASFSTIDIFSKKFWTEKKDEDSSEEDSDMES